MSRTIQQFFTYEISEMHKNIDRIESHLSYGKHNPGQQALLAIQNEHLAMIQDLKSKIHNGGDLSALCHQMIHENEELHRKIALRESDRQQHSAEWWHSLHTIQFWSDFLHRYQSWISN